jgi:hypothetical protein
MHKTEPTYKETPDPSRLNSNPPISALGDTEVTFCKLPSTVFTEILDASFPEDPDQEPVPLDLDIVSDFFSAGCFDDLC